jgi:hypothetical protein
LRVLVVLVVLVVRVVLVVLVVLVVVVGLYRPVFAVFIFINSGVRFHYNTWTLFLCSVL